VGVCFCHRETERELGRGNATCWREVEEGEDTEKSVAEDGGKNNKGTSVGMAGSSQQQPWPSPRHFRSLLSITRPTVSLLPVNALYAISSSSSYSCAYCNMLDMFWLGTLSVGVFGG
jgi:hypothetical protein